MGGNLPPGCTDADIDRAANGNPEAEWNRVYAEEFDRAIACGLDEETADKAATWSANKMLGMELSRPRHEGEDLCPPQNPDC